MKTNPPTFAKRILASTVVSLIALFGVYEEAAAQVLTEQLVSKFVDSMIASAVQQDAQKIMNHFSDDAVIMARIPPEQGGLLIFSKNDYAKYLVDAYAQYGGNSSLRVDEISITLHQDGQGATVTDNLTETIISGEQTFSGLTFQTTIIEMRSGMPKVVLSYGRLTTP